MRRGYTREAYLALIERVREIVKGCSISSDFITGFCGETEEDHQMTLSLMQSVRFDMAFMFAYSMREKTHAHRHFSFVLSLSLFPSSQTTNQQTNKPTNQQTNKPTNQQTNKPTTNDG